ncbi:MAG: DUF4145 domain-containing protein [Prevotella sp.]|nr:DUF4145 domain-containing protein [Prevotella sp.]
MEYIYVRYREVDGSEQNRLIQKVSIKCPFCKIQMIPNYLYSCVNNENGVNAFCQCTNPDCKKPFISEYILRNNMYVYSRILPNLSLDKKEFGAIISEISPIFCDIYNQAYAAQQMNLSQICGVGYRKALEFLIKDYIMSGIEDDKKDGIKQKNLAKCIKEDISSPNVKAVAARATWIGNDETHYVRKWEDKDIKDLIGMIDLTIRWIESEVETKRLLEEMPML